MSRFPRILFLLLGVTTSACRGCSEDGASASRPSADAASAPSRIPYLPSRSTPEDTPGPSSAVETALLTLKPKLNECYRTAAGAQPNLEGQATFTLTISPGGRVSDVTVLSQSGLDLPFIGCLSKVLESAAFAPPGNTDSGAVKVNVPLAFKPPGKRSDGG